MATTQLTASVETNKSKGKVIWESKETLASATEGATYILPNQAGKIENWLVGLIISSGSGYIQYSISNRADVIAGTANWRTWDAGTVSISADDVLFPVTAVRQVNVSGTTLLEVRVV